MSNWRKRKIRVTAADFSRLLLCASVFSSSSCWFFPGWSVEGVTTALEDQGMLDRQGAVWACKEKLPVGEGTIDS